MKSSCQPRGILPANSPEPAPMVAQRLRQARSLHAEALSFLRRTRSPTQKIALRNSRNHLRISLLDSTGHFRRLDYSPTTAREEIEMIVVVPTKACANIPAADPISFIFPAGMEGGMEVLGGISDARWRTLSVDQNASMTRSDVALTSSFKVNGVRIARRGGSWGMDDSRKRVSREKLEPYFRLHREANVNIIRNWVGQNTEETFYDLADEYGFWSGTISGRPRRTTTSKPQDPALFLENARDTILRFRNHPSIVDLVRPQRRRAAAHHQRRPRSTDPLARRNALLLRPVRTRSICKTAARTDTSIPNSTSRC